MYETIQLRDLPRGHKFNIVDQKGSVLLKLIVNDFFRVTDDRGVDVETSHDSIPVVWLSTFRPGMLDTCHPGMKVIDLGPLAN